MSKTVFILGAGASKKAGVPLMGNFLDVASDLLAMDLVNNRRDDFERVFTAIGGLQAVHSKSQLDLNNIESIFTALELGKIIRRVPGIDASEIPTTIASLKEVIVNTIEATMKFPWLDNSIHAPEPYGHFAELIKHLRDKSNPPHESSVITFNYDIGVDFALSLAGIDPNYIIDGIKPTRRSIDLLKLHGSINWALEQPSQKIIPLHINDYLLSVRVGNHSGHKDVRISIGSNLKDFVSDLHPSAEFRDEPVIVPPSWNKADYHAALSDVWARAASHLSEAEYIFVIGYSLPETDSFFRHLFALGSVGKSQLRKIIVFNPDQSIDDRFRAMLGPGAAARYSFLQTDFANAISTIRALFSQSIS